MNPPVSNPRPVGLLAWAGILLAAALAACAAGPRPEPGVAPAPPPPDPSPYGTGPASPEGTGRFYMGREISRPMEPQDAARLERPSRQREERTDLLLERLPLQPDDVVVDLGAGTGYLSLALAERVPQGRVLAVDLEPELLAIVQERADRAGLAHLEPVQASATDPNIPADSTDLVLVVHAYPELSHPRELMEGVAEGLRPGGQLYLVEYRGEDPAVAAEPLRKMTEAQAIREIEAVGLHWVETKDFLPTQHVLVFAKPGAGGPADGSWSEGHPEEAGSLD